MHIFTVSYKHIHTGIHTIHRLIHRKTDSYTYIHTVSYTGYIHAHVYIATQRLVLVMCNISVLW